MMSVNSPFTPTGNTVTFTGVITTPPTPVQANSYSLGSNQYRILNSGTVTVFLGVGNTAAGATANATVVTNNAAAIPLLAGTDEILSFLPNAYFTGITGSSSAVVYITPGSGS
jgi:hypothetical protein